jgi:hypothetical protein
MSSNQTISDVNNLLRQASKAIMCGPDCQKNEKMSQLYQTYLDSKTNLINAPQQVEQSAKNYYMFAEGPQGYNDYLTNSLDEKSTAIINLIQDQFNNNLKSGQSALKMYSGVSVNYNSVIDLYGKYKNENAELERKYKNDTNDIFTNDRKTYYANQGIDNLNYYYKALMYVYAFVVFICLVSMFALKNDLSLARKIIIFICLVLYPFVIIPVYKAVILRYNSAIAMFPKNVYKTI